MYRIAGGRDIRSTLGGASKRFRNSFWSVPGLILIISCHFIIITGIGCCQDDPFKSIEVIFDSQNTAPLCETVSQITSFEANNEVIKKGEDVRLTWDTEYSNGYTQWLFPAERSLFDEMVPRDGNKMVTPNGTTCYVLMTLKEYGCSKFIGSVALQTVQVDES